MKKSITALLLMTLFSFASTLHAYESASETFTQIVSGSDYTIKVTVKDISTGNGAGQLHEFSVYKDGNFLHADSSPYFAGRIFECRNFGPETGLSEYLNAEPVKTNLPFIIWRVTVREGCGNAVRINDVFISVQAGSDEYRIANISGREGVHLVETNDELIAYYNEQEYGLGGTSTSVLVPRKTVLVPRSEDRPLTLAELANGNIFSEENFNAWGGNVHFINVFFLGLTQKDPELTKFALGNLYKHEDEQWYESFFLGAGFTTKDTYAYFRTIHNRLRHYRQSVDKLHETTPLMEWLIH